MTPMLAVLVALLPFAGLIGPLVWMARTGPESQLD
jgi:uncharacterized Tic20 family protein